MFLVLKQDWDVLDATKEKGSRKTTILAGRHEIERIANPCGHDAVWLVLKGTLIGATEGSLREFPEYVTIEE